MKNTDRVCACMHMCSCITVCVCVMVHVYVVYQKSVMYWLIAAIHHMSTKIEALM